MEWVLIGLWMLSLLVGIALVGVDIPPSVRRTDDVLGDITKRPRMGHKRKITHSPLPFLGDR